MLRPTAVKVVPKDNYILDVEIEQSASIGIVEV